ncbi:uracil-DNA glycosylase [Candidatus Pacebacteria bacterium]|nr:uracil-DNA glycosylase [Candidatus Paceibacterota bacterium]
MDVEIEQSWKNALTVEFEKDYFADLSTNVRHEYENETIYPPAKLVFNAFNHCSFDDVKVVILGQDPYHGRGQAMGLSFSVPEGVRIPPSLQNIYKEIEADLGVKPLSSGNLERWAKQGVLLLNATLTVRAGEPGSHQGLGWEQFTDAVIEITSDEREHIVFVLWGAYAQSKADLIDDTKHLVLKAPHPSPLSAHRGFFGCQHFSLANEYLQSHALKPIDW